MSNATRRSDLPRALANALTRGRIAHAYLLAGPGGSGKLAAAKALASALLCQSEAERPCGHCRACALVARGCHPDLKTLAPEGETNKAYTIAQVRRLIADMAERPLLSSCRVFILMEADRMRTEAANALLKTLEEPPPHGRLLLVSAHPEMLPDTIISRCQVVRFTPPALAEAETELAGAVPPGLIRFVARVTGGDAERAGELVSEHDLVGLREQAFDLMRGARRHDEDWLLMAAERAESYRREGDKLPLYLDLISAVCRDALAHSLGADATVLDDAGRAGDLADIAAMFTVEELAAMIEECEKTKDLIKKNVNTRLALEVLFLRLRVATRARGRGVQHG